MNLNWMKNKDRVYKEVKEKAKNREEWYHWNLDLPEQVENQRRRSASDHHNMYTMNE